MNIKQHGSNTTLDYKSDYIKYINRLDCLLLNSGVQKEDICLVGSACLAVRGIRRNSDLDFVARTDQKQRLKQCIKDGKISVLEDRYQHLGISDKDLIHNSDYYDIVNGFKVIRPEVCLSYKIQRKKKKDEYDILLISEYIRNTDDWDWNLFIRRVNNDDGDENNQTESGRIYKTCSNIYRTIRSINSNGLLDTLERISYTLLKSGDHKKGRFVLDLKKNLTRNSCLDTRFIHVRDLIGYQFNSMEFTAWDIPLERSDYDFDPEMHGLTTNVKKKYSNGLEPVVTDEKFRIANPETFNKYVDSEIQRIPTLITSSINVEEKNRKWIESRPVNLDDLEVEKVELLYNTGYFVNILVWIPDNEITKAINNRFEKGGFARVDVRRFDVGSSILNFVDDLYLGFTAPFSIEYKKHLLSERDTEICLMTYMPPESKNDTFSSITNMKSKLRQDLSDSFSVDYDLIIHAPYTPSENIHLQKILNDYTDNEINFRRILD